MRIQSQARPELPRCILVVHECLEAGYRPLGRAVADAKPEDVQTEKSVPLSTVERRDREGGVKPPLPAQL
jgi:hypothetical protein